MNLDELRAELGNELFEAAGFNTSHAVAYAPLPDVDSDVEGSDSMSLKHHGQPFVQSIDIKEGDIVMMSPFQNHEHKDYFFKGEREVEIVRWSNLRKNYRISVNDGWWDRSQLMVKGVDYNE